MIALVMKFETPFWPELDDKLNTDKIIHLGNDAPPLQIGILDNGMNSGAPSAALRIDLPDGKVVIMETSCKLLVTIGRAIESKYPGVLDM